ncbi:TPA: hypothetical protein KM432_003879 [Clostridioides difficile]|uniref:cyclic GMP-AMP synthase DncV-like nucleotidyltransferase n=1 Tax=Clostridioides difficile TaxID=1496 RepID=UPI0009450A6A|nr:hypothetical protein [Clostridioides difficile]MCW0772803.1 hypothetical protein [Clostridioides difficile]HBE8719199.1 hypothetical protein [Clostridioides difficile]
MADLNNLFLGFNDKITLSPSKKENLRIGRDALRKKIKDKFSEKGRNKPKFCGQGSYMMKTTTNPIDGEYDLDDGVYLQGYSDKEIDEWPLTSTVHNWIKDAVDGHTSTSPMDKNTCVRVIYVNDYHIDLPAYIVKDDVAYLSHKRDGWIVSDPKSFTDWFVGKVTDKGEQLRRLVKYLKAWKEYKGIDLKGIAVTILVGENYYSYDNRDDLSLLGTLTNIIETLEEDFKCVKPVAPNEDIFDGYSETKKNSILSGLKNLRDSVQDSINKEDEKEASDIMIECFGNRFPQGKSSSKENKSQYVRAESPAIIKNDGRSA